MQWCIAKNGSGYTQRGVAKGLKVPCLFMIAEVSIRCQKNPEVGIRRIPAYTPPQYTTGLMYICLVSVTLGRECVQRRRCRGVSSGRRWSTAADGETRPRAPPRAIRRRPHAPVRRLRVLRPPVQHGHLRGQSGTSVLRSTHRRDFRGYRGYAYPHCLKVLGGTCDSSSL